MNATFTRQFSRKADATAQAKHLTRAYGVKMIVKAHRPSGGYWVTAGSKGARAKLRRAIVRSDVYAGVVV